MTKEEKEILLQWTEKASLAVVRVPTKHLISFLSRGSCLHETPDSITKSQVSNKPL